VTICRKLIETSGTMSGGGNTVQKGKMKLSVRYHVAFSGFLFNFCCVVSQLSTTVINVVSSLEWQERYCRSGSHGGFLAGGFETA
jgi:hypothetical protein